MVGVHEWAEIRRMVLVERRSQREAVSVGGRPPVELWPRRPDRIEVVPSATLRVGGYVYKAGGQKITFDPSQVMHTKFFHPTNDWYGMSPLEAAVGDLFDPAPGRYDLIAFDPPFRWFAAADMAERATADEGYGALTRFFAEAADHLTPTGRILLSFGNTGDIDYLHELIDRHGFRCEELRRVEGQRDGVDLAYVAHRLTIG